MISVAAGTLSAFLDGQSEAWFHRAPSPEVTGCQSRLLLPRLLLCFSIYHFLTKCYDEHHSIVFAEHCIHFTGLR